MDDNSIIYYGASQTVTGSNFIAKLQGVKICIDCGMFQGADVDLLNYESFKYNPADLEFVIITHAHLDHCGLLPKLVKHGFKGKIYLTPQTAEIVKVILFDSAKLQELRENLNQVDLPIIYNTADVENTIMQFELLPFNKAQNLTNDVSFKFIPAGHILGSANVYIEAGDKSYLFSGDIGRQDQSIIKRFSDFDNKTVTPDYIIMESLYGGELHESRDENMKVLLENVNQTLKSSGKVIMPVFALHRAQEMLELLKYYFENKLVKPNINVYLDSPMAINITDIYNQFSSDFNSSHSILNKIVHFDNNARFDFEQLKNVRKSKKSQRLNNNQSAIILAGSGMADGGRVVRHIQNSVEDSRNVIVFVGYQAEGTLGRKLIEGEKSIVINNKTLQVNAKILYLRGFSAHADSNDLLAWLESFNLSNLKKVFLVHSDIDRAEKFANILNEKNIESYIPSMDEGCVV